MAQRVGAVTVTPGLAITPIRTAVAHATSWRGYYALNLTFANYLLAPKYLWATFGLAGVSRMLAPPWK